MLALGKAQRDGKENGNDGVEEQIGGSWKSFHDFGQRLKSIYLTFFFFFCIIDEKGIVLIFVLCRTPKREERKKAKCSITQQHSTTKLMLMLLLQYPQLFSREMFTVKLNDD